MNAAVGLMDGLGLDGDRCIRVIPRQYTRNSYLIIDETFTLLSPHMTELKEMIIGNELLMNL